MGIIHKNGVLTQYSLWYVQSAEIASNFLKMILQEIAPSAKRRLQITEKILAADNGAPPHQGIREIYAQSTENQKIGLSAGFHSKCSDIL